MGALALALVLGLIFPFCVSSHIVAENSRNVDRTLDCARFLQSYPSHIRTNSNRNRSASLTLTHIYGACSPSPLANASRKQISSDLLQRDSSRARLMRARINPLPPAINNTKLGQQKDTLREPLVSGVEMDIGIYITRAGFGTPPMEFYLGIDTGSDITWIQCAPCYSPGSCYHQQDPMFDPAASSSYRSLACDSAQCAQAQSFPGATIGCARDVCTYGIHYVDGSVTRGILSLETLNLGASAGDPNSVQILEFVFGCGHENRGTFGNIAGLLGLGRSPFAFPAQTSPLFNAVFAYCLPSIFTTSSSGFLLFGDSVEFESHNVYTTALIAQPEYPSLYFVALREIRVNYVAVQVAASLADYYLGTVIDSGTIISRLETSTYAALRDAFVEQTRLTNGLSPMENSPISLFDTCYRVDDASTAFPNVSFCFDGMDDVVELPVDNVLYPADDDVFCLAFAPHEFASISVIGSFQQQGFGIVFDVPRSTIGISPGACSD